MFLQRAMPFTIVVFLLALAGCKASERTPEEPTSRPASDVESTSRPAVTSSSAVEEAGAGTVVIDRTTRAPVEGDRVLSDEEISSLERAFGDALTLRDAQDYGRSLEILRGALAFDPPEPYRQRLRTLEYEVHKLLFTETYISAFITLEKDRCTIGDVIEGDVVLMNISTDTLVIPASSTVAANGAKASPDDRLVLLRTNVLYREFQPTYTIVDRQNSINYRVDEDIVLLSGESRRFPLVIDTMDINPSGTMFRTYTFSCELRAFEVRVGQEVFHETIKFRPTVAKIFPRNAEHLSESPLERIDEAFRKNAPLHLSVAAAYLDEADRRFAYRYFEERLRRPELGEAMQRGILTALRILSGVALPYDKSKWLEWLSKEAS